MQEAVGWTMAEFMTRSGLAPHDMYPTPGNGRTFVVEGRSVTVVTSESYGAPTVASTSACRILLNTFQEGPATGLRHGRSDASMGSLFNRPGFA